MSDELRAKIDLRQLTLSRFIDAETERLALACRAMAERLGAGGRLFAFGRAAAASDATHVSVEFMHPVIVGKRALAALALGSGTELESLARPGDLLMVLCHGEPGEPERRVADAARRRGLLTIALTGPGEVLPADFCFGVDCADAQVVQEVHETAYHVLWELVHVFLEAPHGAGDRCITCGDVGVQARVVVAGEREAVVEGEAGRESVAIDLVGPVVVGDTVLCHAGVALEKL